MSIEKIRPSFTFTEDRQRELQAIMPEAFADGKINWDTLREALGEYLEEEGQEHYGISWPGKRDARRLANKPSKMTLVPQSGQGVNEQDTHNIFIEGDNLEVLKLLQKSYAGRIKMIYIDPPYNTGNDFIYQDNYEETLDSYLKQTGQVDEVGKSLTTNLKASGRFHSNWLNMMYPRLLLARNLLRDDGVIFVSIDDNEASNLHSVMNEVFGEENYISTLYIQVRYPDKTLVEDADFHKSIEIVYVYGKTPEAGLNKESQKYTLDKFVWSVREKGPADRTLQLGNKKVELFSRDNYEIFDVEPSEDNLKEIWATGKILDGNSSGRFFRDYLNGRFVEDGYGVLYKVYGIGDDKFPYRYFTGPKKEGATKGKYYQGVPSSVLANLDSTQKSLPIPNFYNFADNFGNCRHEGGVDFRSGKKPIEFLKTLLRLGTNPLDEDIVLDFFGGSCSTAHAVLDQNFIDGGNRQFILVQIQEPAKDSSFSTISELGKERIRKTISSYSINKQGTNLDFGFLCVKLDKSNFQFWEGSSNPDIHTIQTLFDTFESPLINNWKSENLLFETILLQGLPIDSTVSRNNTFTKNSILEVSHNFCGHSLFICLDEKISQATVDAISIRPEDIFVCLDIAMSDEDKIRLSDRCNLKVI
jgi:adenine-specific DNA-methyltransferase